MNERAWRIAQLAAALAQKTVVKPSRDGKEVHSTYTRKLELEWLVQDADYLLEAAERVARVEHAYSLFQDQKEFWSVQAIGNKFAAAEWHGLTSWPSVSNLLEEILKELKQLGPIEVGEIPEPEHEALPALNVPSADPTVLTLWALPFARGAAKRKEYRVRNMLYLAHLLCRERFRQRIERLRPPEA